MNRVCFCSPVQGWKPAVKLLDFVESLDTVAGKQAASAFTMHLFGAGNSARIMKGKLESKGYTVSGSYACFGWSRLVANFGPRIFMRGHPDAGELERARLFGERFSA